MWPCMKGQGGMGQDLGGIGFDPSYARWDPGMQGLLWMATL